MSARFLKFQECISIIAPADFQKNFLIKLVLLLTCKSMLQSSSVKAAEIVAFDIPCINDTNCTIITGTTTCDLSTGQCICADGNIRMKHFHHCLRFAEAGEDCQIHEQCTHSDTNMICSTWSKRCRCRAGFEHGKSSNNTKLCIKSRHVGNEPYIVHLFSGLGPVHIILGCLTGGLALLACAAGMIQLVRKKYIRYQCDGRPHSEFSPDLGYSTTSVPSQPFSDSQFTNPPSRGDFACLDGNSTAPPTPGSLRNDEAYVVTPPPSYEEAVQSDRDKTGSVITV